MVHPTLFSRGCCNNLTARQVQALEGLQLSGEVFDSDKCKESVNTCGSSIGELLSTFDLYGTYQLPGNTSLSYNSGDVVLVWERDGEELSLWQATGQVSQPIAGFDPSLWEKTCGVRRTDLSSFINVEDLEANYSYFDSGLFIDGDESQPKEFLYQRGDFFIALGPCESTLCLYVVEGEVPATEDIATRFKEFSPSEYWTKVYCVATAEDKCASPRRTRAPAEAYELVQIGSRGHYVERPLPFKLAPKQSTLDEASSRLPPETLTQEQIDSLPPPV